MNRQHIAWMLRMASLVAAAASLVAIVQFVRGEIPNPLLWFVTPSPIPEGVLGPPFGWIASVYGWLAGVGVYVAAGLLSSVGCAVLSRIIEIGWDQYRAEQRSAKAEYDRWATVERARAERRQRREVARAKHGPSSVGAVLFGIALGWFFFH
jgi:hypothetical protein